MTKKEFIIQHKAFEEGMISAYQNIMIHCHICIKAHREEITKKRLNEIADMNNHLWK